MRNVSATVLFDEGSVIIGEVRCTDWKVGWKKLKKILSEGQKRNKQQSLAEKELQNEIPKQYSEDDFGWFKCNTDPRKTSSMFALQKQMIETADWWIMPVMWGAQRHRETVQHLLSGCKKLAGSKCVKQHDNTWKVLAVKLVIENGLLPYETKWYAVNCERGTVIENDGKKLYWDTEHRMRTKCIVRRPDLTLEDTANC